MGKGVRWSTVETASPLAELPAVHRAFLKMHRPGLEADALPLRRVQQYMSQTLALLVAAGMAQKVDGEYVVGLETTKYLQSKFVERLEKPHRVPCPLWPGELENSPWRYLALTGHPLAIPKQGSLERARKGVSISTHSSKPSILAEVSANICLVCA